MSNYLITNLQPLIDKGYIVLLHNYTDMAVLAHYTTKDIITLQDSSSSVVSDKGIWTSSYNFNN